MYQFVNSWLMDGLDGFQDIGKSVVPVLAKLEKNVSVQ